MRAAVNMRYGPPEVVKIEDVDPPEIGERDLLVRVHATTVNRTDCGYRAAKPFIVRPFSGWVRPRATVLGNEFAGEVTAVGPQVSTFAVGDRVFGYCEGTFGAHAEYLRIAHDASVARMPDAMTFEECAPGTEGSHYALSFIRRAGVRSGHRVLVNGATGAIGSAAVQILKTMGSQVTAVCAGDSVALVQELGADRVIDYTSEDFTKLDETFDVVFDAVGKSTFGACRDLLAPRGVYVSTDLGPWSQNPFLALVTPLGRGPRVVFPFPTDDQSVVEHLRDLMASGAFRPVVDRRYDLSEIVEAYRYVETGQKIGNVVITVRP
jgi:NADPH:quinone reductase-like Zn-dependent oxidoreductase